MAAWAVGRRVPDNQSGYRLVSRRLLNGLQFFPALLQPLAALLVGPPALALPLLDSLDRERNFTLGYLCTARKSS